MTWHRQQWSLAATLVTMLAWVMNFAFVKYVLEHIGVWPLMFIRFVTLPLLAFALLALVFRGRIAQTWPKRADLPRFVACGLLGHTAHIAMVMYGMNLSTAFSSSLVLTSGPLFTLMILAVYRLAVAVRRLASTARRSANTSTPRRPACSTW